MLNGMRIISFCHYLQGPACSQYLADLGADVIKIEPPHGAFERHWSGGHSYVDGISAFMLSANRNKRSLAVDLKKPEAEPIVGRLLDWANVLVENHKPGVLDRLGLGYDRVCEVNPSIIYASATAYGPDGPDKNRPGQDLLMQARSGLMAATGNRDSGPVATGCAPIDQHGGALLALGIVSAHVQRLQTGKGTRIEGSLFNAALDLQSEALTKYMCRRPGREIFQRDAHVGSWYHNAPYGVYKLTDAYIALSMNDPLKLANSLNSDYLRGLVNLDMYEQRDEFARAVASTLASHSLDQVEGPFNEHGIWFEPVRDYEDLLYDPQALHNQVFHSVDIGDQTATVVNHPLRYDGELRPTHRFPFHAGQDTTEVLDELGFSTNQIEGFYASGIVAGP